MSTPEAIATATVLATRERLCRPAPNRRSGRPEPTLYQVLLSSDDLRLLQVCATWICGLGPAPDIRARLTRLEQRLDGARPVR